MSADFIEIPWAELEPLCGYDKELAGMGGTGTCYRGVVRGQDAAVKVFHIPAGPAGGEADAAFQRFAAAGMHVVRSVDPIGSWPGVDLAPRES